MTIEVNLKRYGKWMLVEAIDHGGVHAGGDRMILTSDEARALAILLVQYAVLADKHEAPTADMFRHAPTG